MEAAIQAMPATATVAAAAAPQHTKGRAVTDLSDAERLSGAIPGEDADAAAAAARRRRANETARKRKSGTMAASIPGHRNKILYHPSPNERNRSHSDGGTTRRSGHRRQAINGAAAATALLAGAGSTVAAGARGLQLAMIKEAFSRLDMDGDGYITAGDLRLAFRNMGRDASDRR